MADRWEYLNLVHDGVTEDREGFLKRLNVYGVDGWEVYAVTRDGVYATYHMKCALPERVWPVGGGH